MTVKEKVAKAMSSPFGTVFTDKMSVSWFKDGAWSPRNIEDVKPLGLMPYAHVFHYASTCFEGLKVHRQHDGSLKVFRLDRHIKRFRQSCELLCLPVPDADHVESMIRDVVDVCREWAPEHPGSLYVRPTIIGTMESIGAAAGPSTDACFFVLLSPVGDYFQGGLRALKLLLDDEKMRTAGHFGMAKAGGNYACALNNIVTAKRDLGVDQVLFAPNGDIQETGAANFLMINDNEIRTKHLDATFLHGVTRDSILTLAGDMGYKVNEGRISPAELLEWIKTGETALSGTAAVLSGVGEFVYHGERYTVGNGDYGPNTNKLRKALLSIQNGTAEDKHGWLSEI